MLATTGPAGNVRRIKREEAELVQVCCERVDNMRADLAAHRLLSVLVARREPHLSIGAKFEAIRRATPKAWRPLQNDRASSGRLGNGRHRNANEREKDQARVRHVLSDC
jgi:hypothetical protein